MAASMSYGSAVWEGIKAFFTLGLLGDPATSTASAFSSMAA